MQMNFKARHLTLEEREIIAQSLTEGMNFKEIGNLISRHPSTIAREVARHKEYVKKRLSFSGSLNHTCSHLKDCSVRNLCSSCKSMKFCKHCIQRDCTAICKKYHEVSCALAAKPPYVCNSCNRKTNCRFDKFYYRASSAHKAYHSGLRESRQGINLEPWELGELDDLVSPLILQGQSIAHIYASHTHEIPCSIRTLYEYITQGLFSVTDLDLRRKVSYRKRRKASNTPCNYRYRQGRTYEDFVRFTGENPDAAVTETDTLEGSKGDEKVLLTLYLRSFRFMLAFLMDNQDMENVLRQFHWLEDILGLGLFRDLFPVILTDNGAEFKDPVSLEEPLDTYDGLKRTRIFYCDPGKAYQKGGIEKNHELIRYVIPKGASLEAYTQKDIDLVINHINSYSRNERAPFTPFDLMEKACPDLIKKLGLKRIHPDEILLSPQLLKKDKI
ncbi:MAG TPA: IS30 family transposase [Anaerovoracaceae bacterium]|nr:IS30 family transposase [Anaerovoracaceae bacterium]